MVTEGLEIKDSDSSSGQTGVNQNNDDVASGSSCHETMETNSCIDKPIAGPSHSSSDVHLVSDGSQSSSSKSNEGGILSFPFIYTFLVIVPL